MDSHDIDKTVVAVLSLTVNLKKSIYIETGGGAWMCNCNNGKVISVTVDWMRWRLEILQNVCHGESIHLNHNVIIITLHPRSLAVTTNPVP